MTKKIPSGDSGFVACEFQSNASAPQEGCPGWIAEPETVRCPEPAVTVVALPEAEAGEYRGLRVCRAHADLLVGQGEAQEVSDRLAGSGALYFVAVPEERPEFVITQDGKVIDPAAGPDLSRPGAARAVLKLVEHLAAMDDDEEADR